MMNPTFRRLGKTGAMEVGAHSDAHFQLVDLNARRDEERHSMKPRLKRLSRGDDFACQSMNALWSESCSA